jgi:hypothetical protein
MPFFEGGLLIGHPTFTEGSGAAHRPVEISAPDIAYTTEGDEAIDAYRRKSGVK